MYFAQESGEPLGWKFVRTDRGPHAADLHGVLASIEGRLITGSVIAENAPDSQLSFMPGAVDGAMSVLRQRHDMRARFDRVAKLIDGFETPFGLELLAAVHWIATRESSSGEAIVSGVRNFSVGSGEFNPRQIGLAERWLSAHGWISSFLQ
jgi:hypothetical protein